MQAIANFFIGPAPLLRSPSVSSLRRAGAGIPQYLHGQTYCLYGTSRSNRGGRGARGYPRGLRSPYFTSENKPRENICGVVVRGVSSKAVVVQRRAVECPVPGVLRGEVDILHGPPGQVDDVAAVLGAAVETAGDARTIRVENVITRAGGIEPAERAGEAVAEVVFRVRPEGVEMVRHEPRQPESVGGAGIQRRILMDVGAADRENVVAERGNRAVVLNISRHVGVVVP